MGRSRPARPPPSCCAARTVAPPQSSAQATSGSHDFAIRVREHGRAGPASAAPLPGGAARCPAHAWTYPFEGQCIGAPHMSEVEGFQKRDYPLRSPAFAEWEGFLMINLAPDAEPFAQAFAPLVGRFARFNIATLRSARRIDYDVRANWKLIFQNYSECLHCPVIHPELAKLAPYTSGENDLVDGPFLGGYMTITREGGSLSLSGRACGVPVGELPAADLNRAYFYTIFPNLLLSLHPDYVMFHTLWPDGPARTRISCEWMFHRDSLSRPQPGPEDA